MGPERERGWALPVLLVVVAVLLAAGGALLAQAVAAERMARLERLGDAAFYAAEAGLQLAVAWTYGWGGFGWTMDPGADSRRLGTVQAVLGPAAVPVGTYELSWVREADNRYRITAVGRAGPAMRTLTAQMEYDAATGQVRIIAYLPA